MIEAENLSFSYTGAPPFVLNGVNLTVRRGDYISVVGENGCGKSTLMRLMLGFLKPSSGSIASEASRTGYVPQRNDFSNADFPITVQELLNSYRRLLKLHERDAVKKSLRRVGLEELGGALMGTLSGGQAQRILIARALMGDPELLILDEPSAGVDIGSQKEIYALLKSLNQNQRITIVSVEHNLEAAVENSTLIYHLAGGRGHLCTPRQYAGECVDGPGYGDGRADGCGCADECGEGGTDNV